MPNNAVLKLPLIGKIDGIECFNCLSEHKHIEFPKTDQGDPRELEEVEKALGDFLLDSGNCERILKLLFPTKDNLDKEKVKTLLIDQNFEDAPLFVKIFLRGHLSHKNVETLGSQDTDKELERLRSAWSDLMLNLGEFKLEERFDLLRSQIIKEIQYTYSISGSGATNILNACFVNSSAIIDEIWIRILKPDTLVVFIDDDKDFGDKWGLKVEPVEITENGVKDAENFNCTEKIWIKPTDGFPEGKIKKKVKEIIQLFEEKKDEIKNLVFVVDLLYKMNGINRIKGDELIRFLRNDDKINPLIIGFTAGNSPFLINSAVRAGADIVIPKERGENVRLPGSHGSGNPGGLFDLLWALSKNINRWRFLESYKEWVDENTEKPDFNYQPPLDKLFFAIEDESPFWRKYLKDWQRETEDIRLKSILFKNR